MLNFNKLIYFECASGYSRDGGEDAIKCLENGQWDNHPPTCKSTFSTFLKLLTWTRFHGVDTGDEHHYLWWIRIPVHPFSEHLVISYHNAFLIFVCWYDILWTPSTIPYMWTSVNKMKLTTSMPVCGIYCIFISLIEASITRLLKHDIRNISSLRNVSDFTQRHKWEEKIWWYHIRDCCRDWVRSQLLFEWLP